MAQAKRKPLNHASIVAAAAQLMDEQGVEALTMRRLALRLGVTHPALYKHFSTADEISDAVAAALCARLPRLDPALPLALRDQMVDYLIALRELQLTHPAVLNHRIGSRAWEVMAGFGNAQIRVINAAGGRPTQNTIALRVVQSYALDSAEMSRRSATGDSVAEGAQALTQLPADQRDALDGVDMSLTLEDAFGLAVDRMLPHLLDLKENGQ